MAYEQMEKCRTGIPNFDEALEGGIPKGNTILVAGASGAGKTILCSEFIFEGYRLYKEPGLYLCLTEPVFKSINNLKNFSFFNEDYLAPDKVLMIDLKFLMKERGIDEKIKLGINEMNIVLDLIEKMAATMGLKRLVIDSITALCHRLGDEGDIREFMFKLGSLLSNIQCTTLLVSEIPPQEERYSYFGVEEFISDGIIKMGYELRRNELFRKMRIVKIRGSNFNDRLITYKINKEGFILYPELMLEVQKKSSTKRISSGNLELDKMIGGGLFVGSINLLSGSAGTGKSNLGLFYLLDGLKKNENCLLMNYEESKQQIFRNAASFGISLEQYEKKGKLKIIQLFPEELNSEEHIVTIQKSIDEFLPDRCIIDSVSAVRQVFAEDEFRDFIKRLSFYLKSKDITTLLLNTTSGVLLQDSISELNISTIVDNIILLKYVEVDSEIRRFITVLKARGTEHDKKLREYLITKDGMQIIGGFKNFTKLFSGSAENKADEKLLKAFQKLASE